jgi:hypothetical protein
MNAVIARWLTDNPGHALTIETVSHPPVGVLLEGRLEWIATLATGDGLLLADGAGLTLDFALQDLAHNIIEWATSAGFAPDGSFYKG